MITLADDQQSDVDVSREDQDRPNQKESARQHKQSLLVRRHGPDSVMECGDGAAISGMSVIPGAAVAEPTIHVLLLVMPNFSETKRQNNATASAGGRLIRSLRPDAATCSITTCPVPVSRSV